MKKSRAYQLIASAEVVENLSTKKNGEQKSVHHGGQNEPISYQSSPQKSDLLISKTESVPHGGQNEPIAYQSSPQKSDLLIPQSERVAREIGKAPVQRQKEAWNLTTPAVKRFAL